MANPRRGWTPVYLAALMAALPMAAAGQAIIGTASGSNQGVIFPSPNSGLPTPVQTNVAGLPAGALPHGVAYYGSDNALLADATNSRVFVVQISTAALLGTIPTGPVCAYNGGGSVAVSPTLTTALANSTNTSLCVISAPFGASSTLTAVTLPGTIPIFQTQAIVYNAAGRAFVYNTGGISVLDPPYTSIAFTIPAVNNSGGAIAVSPDGNTILVTSVTDNIVRVLTAPFSAASTSVNLTIPAGGFLDGIVITPDGTRALVVSASVAGSFFSIAAPFGAASVVDTIPLLALFGTHEDIGISADGQLAILAGNASNNTNTAFVRAPFTTAGATVFNVQIPGGRGAGSVRFLPPGLAAGLTISKSAPANATSGSNVTYTITYGNTGTTPATNVIIRDPIPAGSTFVSATGGGAVAAGSVVFNIGTVNAGVTGQTVSFTVNVTATSGNLSNVNYTIEGTGIAPIPGPPVSTQIGGGVVPTPTPTPTTTPTPTVTPVITPPISPVPTLSFPMLGLLAAALAGVAIALMSRRG